MISISDVVTIFFAFFVGLAAIWGVTWIVWKFLCAITVSLSRKIQDDKSDRK